MGKDRYSSRVAKRKDKKVNKIYNILISVVVLLIVVVGAVIFLGGNDEQTTSNDTPATSNTTESDDSGTNKGAETSEDEDGTATDSEDEQADTDESGDDASDSDKDTSLDKDSADSEDENKESEIIEETPSDSNVEKAYTDESWKPVGTEQTGEHVTQYEQGSVDWQEMEKALAYGAGISESDMKVYWLGNGGSPDTAVGTVSPSDDSATYRVQIQWIDGEGWKPTKVEKLKVNDKK